MDEGFREPAGELLQQAREIIVGVDQDGRLNEVSFLAALVATGDRLRALRETGFQITANAIHLFDRDQRPHLRVCIKPRPDSDLLRFFGHAFYHLVEYCLFHVQSRAGTAALSVIEKDGTGSPRNCDVHVGVFEHHVGGFAAQFQRHSLKVASRSMHDQFSDFG